MDDEFNEIIWEIWCVWESLRRFGFKAEEIFVVPGSKFIGAETSSGTGVSLFSQGKRFNVFAGRSDLQKDEIVKQWKRFAEKLNAHEFPQEELESHYSKSPIRKDPATFILALVNAGFHIPRTATKGY